MTFYKTVVSWLAFFLLSWYGIYFGLEVARSLLGRFGPAWAGGGSYQNISSGEVAFSILFAAAAVLLMTPWIRHFLIWRGSSQSEMRLTEAMAENLNTVGRWLLTPLFCYWIFRGLWGSGILVAMLIAPELSVFASSGFTGFIDAVFFPGGRETKPPYTLKLARFYVEKQRWEEAEAEYARLLSFHPEQVEAWQERLAVAFERTDEADPAPEEILAASIKTLPKAEDREAVHRVFAQHRT